MSLETLFSDAEATLDVAVELSSINRAMGTATTWKASRLGVYSSEALPPDLVGLGPFNFALQDDLTFGGLASQTFGTVVLDDKSHRGRYDTLGDYTFAGRAAVIKVGRRTDAYSAWETYRTCLIDGEPAVSGFTASFQLQTALGRLLHEPLEVDRYVGVPTCLRHMTTTGIATAARIAAYDLYYFTVILRFRKVAAGAPSGNVILCRKRVSDTNANWNIRLLATSGAVNFNGSSGGVANNVNLNNSTNYADGEWHTVVCSHQGQWQAYIMVDDTVTAEDTSVGLPDLAVADLQFGVLNNSADDTEICMVALFNRFMPADEARALSSTRLDGSEVGCVGLWLCDDNAGSSANDYSSSANDAAIAGVLNTDHSWQPTDLGDPELAGTPMPMPLGAPFNASAQLIDQARERYRISDQAVSVGTVALRSRGTALTLTTDYTNEGDGAYKMVAAEDEPVTFDVTSSGSSHRTGTLIADTVAARSRVTASSIDELQADAMAALLPFVLGFHTDSEISAASLLAEMWATLGGAYYEDAASDLFLDFLLPPVALGPYSEPCLDIRGKAGNDVNFGAIAGTAGSHTVAAWFKSHGSSRFAIVGAGVNYQLVVGSGSGAVTVTGDEVCFYHQIGISVPDLVGPPGLIQPGVWYFVAGVLDNTAKTRSLYLGPRGGTLNLIGSDSGWTGSPTNLGDALFVGLEEGNTLNTWASISHVQVWHTTKNLAALQALMTTPPIGNEANLAMYAPITEGSGSTVSEKVASGVGTIEGTCAWAPRLSVSLDQTPSARLTEVKRASPVWKSVVRYARNWTVMSSADIDSGVSQANRIKYMREWRDVTLRSETVRTSYLHARELPLSTCLAQRVDAQRLAALMMYRHSTDRMMGILHLPGRLAVSRRALALNFGDEVFVTSSRHGLSSGRSFRVVGMKPNLFEQSVQLALWG